MVRVWVLLLTLVAVQSNQMVFAQQCTRWASLELTEEWRYVPPEDGPSDRLIGRVAWADRDERGVSYVLDGLNNRVVILDSLGNFMKAVGRRGSGPGEFESPRSIRVTSDGGFAVLDEGLSRVEIFSSDGSYERSVLFRTGLPNVRDFLVVDSFFVISGTTAVSEAVVHLYDHEGNYVRGYGNVRKDLKEPVLIARYSDGVLARRSDGAIVFARRTPFQLQVFADDETLLDVTRTDVVPDYVSQVASRVGDGWRFNWRHPALTSIFALPDDCYLVLVQELPADAEDETEYQTVLHVLDRNGIPVVKKKLEPFVWATKYWRDARGDHILSVSIDRSTGIMYPVQYRIDRTTSAR